MTTTPESIIYLGNKAQFPLHYTLEMDKNDNEIDKIVESPVWHEISHRKFKITHLFEQMA